MDTRIYVMTHKEFTKPDDDLYVSLHVGKALGGDFGYVGDNTGTHISEKNKSYCELTGMYWIWKNVSCDIVGICHYRRYFMKNNAFLTRSYVEQVLTDYDLIVPSSGNTQYADNASHYGAVHKMKDLEICRQVVLQMYPDYADAFELCMRTNLATLGNMIITKKGIYDQYCEWLFPILFEVEKRTDISGYDDFQKRLYGYLAERLFRVWLLNSHYRIREEQAALLNPEDVMNASRLAALKYKYVETILNHVALKYACSNAYDETSLSAHKVRFEQKIPVWVCWWQGENEAPQLVKACVKSVRDMLPSDRAQLHFITAENVADYMTFPQVVIEKFQSGAISMQHLADILRAGLLYRYGGVWLDADCYAVKNFSADWLEQKGFWMYRAESGTVSGELSGGRWDFSMVRSQAGNILFKFMLDAFYEYWNMQDTMVDERLSDDVAELAYNRIEAVRTMYETCPYAGYDFRELGRRLNEKYDRNQYAGLAERGTVYKLSYKGNFYRENVAGEETFYGACVRQSE